MWKPLSSLSIIWNKLKAINGWIRSLQFKLIQLFTSLVHNYMSLNYFSDKYYAKIWQQAHWNHIGIDKWTRTIFKLLRAYTQANLPKPPLIYETCFGQLIRPMSPLYILFAFLWNGVWFFCTWHVPFSVSWLFCNVTAAFLVTRCRPAGF